MKIKIGDTAKMQRTWTKQDIDVFGVMSGDMNPTYFSDEFAQMLLERHKVVGHSMWGGALISSLLGNDLPGPGTVYQSQQFEFHHPVELGDALTITVTATSKNADDGSVLFECRAVNQRGENIITGVAKVKAPTKKPTDAGSPYAAMQLHQKTAFKKLIDHVKDWENIPTAVCHPCSKEALEGAIDAAIAGFGSRQHAGQAMGLSGPGGFGRSRLASCAVAVAFVHRLRGKQPIKHP